MPGFSIHSFFHQVDPHISGWMERNGIRMLRISLGIIFVWFGALKLFGNSPDQELAERIVYWFEPGMLIPMLGVWEVLIGIGLLIRPLVRMAIALLVMQMPGTLLPLLILPDICFTSIPFGLTMEGQYIIKNLVLISAAIVVGGSVRKKAVDGHRL